VNNPVIKVENLTKHYRGADVAAVDGISFSVGEGEFFAFLGQNGAGKTTTISILDLDLSAEENIRLHACMYGMYGYRPFFKWMPKAYRERVTELAHVMCIEDKLHKPLKTFSGGMRRKMSTGSV